MQTREGKIHEGCFEGTPHHKYSGKHTLDTDRERNRIKNAFKDDPETKRYLIVLMDSIEAGEWEKAKDMLLGEWWQGRDGNQECPRLEFVGLLKMSETGNPSAPALGFDWYSSYIDFVLAMTDNIDGVEYTVEPIGEVLAKKSVGNKTSDQVSNQVGVQTGEQS